jgi:CheY-like chemotaxis protein
MRSDVPARRVLIVEDESMVAMLIEHIVAELGHRVIATAATLDAATEAIAGASVDFAILDVNLCGRSSFPVAELLAARKIPFVFATGYGRRGLPPEWHHTPVLQKPFRTRDVGRAMRAALTPLAARTTAAEPPRAG